MQVVEPADDQLSDQQSKQDPADKYFPAVQPQADEVVRFVNPNVVVPMLNRYSLMDKLYKKCFL